MEREGIIGDVLPIAQAARNHGGIVIAQVERTVGRIDDPKSVRVPGTLVDMIVVASPEEHAQTFGEQFNGDYVISSEGHAEPAPAGFCERRIIARRALMEILPGEIVNLGIGLPEAVASVAAEEGRLDEFTLTVESGPTGGLPASGLSFGCSSFPEAIIDQPSQFDFYDGGGIDIAVLGAVEVDPEGSVNVTSFAGRFAGVGGFVNIAQNARRLVFCCTFTAGGLGIALDDAGLRIVTEGRHPKFVRRISHVCFHGPTALANGQEVLYVTERAVFELTREGLVLRETAPGIELCRDILPHMGFSPILGPIRTMNASCFSIR